MSVKRELVSGTIYVAIAKYSGFLTTILVSAVLSRILTPADYGVVALATVMMTFFSLFSDIGIAPAVIQERTLDKDDVNSIFTFSIYMGIIFSLLFFLSAPLIAKYYKNDEMLNICRWISISIFIHCALTVPGGLLSKELRFKFKTQLALVLQVIHVVLSIYMAFMGYGVMSLILPGLITTFLRLVVYVYVTKVHFVLRIDWSPLRRIFGFSMYQFMANIVAYISRNIDSMLVGKYIGMQSLGFYNKSVHLMLMPLQQVSGVLNPVMLPVFSQYKDNLNYIEQKYSQILRFFAFIGVILSVILFFCAEELILFLFGDQWGPSVPCFKILAISIPFQILGYSSGPIFQAIGRTNAMFWNSFIGSFLTLIIIAVCVIGFGNIEVLACGYTITMIITTFICFYILFRALNSSFVRFLQVMLEPFLFAIFLTALLWSVSLIPISISFVAMILKGAIGVLFSLFYIQYRGVYDAFSLVKKFRNKIFKRKRCYQDC